TELDHSPIKSRRPNINAEVGSHLRKVVSRLTVAIEPYENSIELAISRRRRIEGQVFSRCSIDDPAASSKLRMDSTKIVPGGTTPAAPSLVPAKKWRRNKWRDCPVSQHVSPSIARRCNLAKKLPPSTCQQQLCEQGPTIVAHGNVAHFSAEHDVVP